MSKTVLLLLLALLGTIAAVAALPAPVQLPLGIALLALGIGSSRRFGAMLWPFRDNWETAVPVALLVMTTLGMVVTSAWSITHPEPSPNVALACRDVANVGDTIGAWSRPYTKTRVDAPRYSGPEWRAVESAMARLMR